MLNFSEKVLKGAQSLNVSNDASAAIQEHVNKFKHHISSLFIEVRPTQSARVDITTCHHFSRQWYDLNIDSSLLKGILALNYSQRPKNLWLEFDNVVEGDKPGVHLSLNEQTSINATTLCDLLFSNSQPISAEQFEHLFSIGVIQHISNLSRAGCATLKLHIKPSVTTLNALEESVGCYITNQLFYDVIAQIDVKYRKYLYFDLSFQDGHILPIYGLYISNKGAQSKTYTKDLSNLMSSLPVTPFDILETVALINQDDDYSLDLKIVFEGSAIYLKAYLGILNQLDVEKDHFANQLMARFLSV